MSTEDILAGVELSLGEEAADSHAGNVGAAMALVILSGGATAVGAAVVYFPSLVNLANSRTLAISLGLSAGVMLFISFVEIFGKSQKSFEKAGFAPEHAYGLAMATFFAGVLLMLISHVAVEQLMGRHHHGSNVKASATQAESSFSDEDNDVEAPGKKKRGQSKVNKKIKGSTTMEEGKEEFNCSSFDPLDDDGDWGTMMLPCCDHEEDVNIKVLSLQAMAREMEEYKEKKASRDICIKAGIPEAALDTHEDLKDLKEQEAERARKDKMMYMSMKTAFAIALHNFPEGLATFVAALDNPKMGLVLAIGIAIHNIPEGLSVSLPMYYATGNRTKAFLCGALSGCTEIIAALLGWAVLASVFTPIVYGVVFGIVAGMMVIISVRELIPTAHQYDPQDKYVTLSLVAGMIIIALSLTLIALF